MRSATTSLLFAATVSAATLAVACATRPSTPPVVTPRLSPEASQAKLAEADGLAARGCYVCLLEAAKGYAVLADVGVFSDPFVLMKKELENDLMLAIREIELRIPDSGARARAYGLRQHVKASYDAHFAILDMMAAPLGERAVTGQDLRLEREARAALNARLEREWPVSPLAAYFYLAFGINSGLFTQPKEDLSKVATAHPREAAVKYRMLVHPAAYTRAVADELLAAEPRFAEVRLLIAQRALVNGFVGVARPHLVLAREVLPTSLAVAAALGPVEFAYARYPQALALWEEILARGADPVAQLGKAEAMSYLKRHQDAIVELDDLLKDPSRHPGEKYYWRAWNKLQLAELQPAYEDATATLKFMNGPDAYRLAGIATFNLERLPEARGYFESALKMYAADCAIPSSTSASSTPRSGNGRRPSSASRTPPSVFRTRSQRRRPSWSRKRPRTQTACSTVRSQGCGPTSRRSDDSRRSRSRTPPSPPETSRLGTRRRGEARFWGGLFADVLPYMATICKKPQCICAPKTIGH